MSAPIRAAVLLVLLLLGACAPSPPPAGDAIPPGPEGMEGDY